MNIATHSEYPSQPWQRVVSICAVSMLALDKNAEVLDGFSLSANGVESRSACLKGVSRIDLLPTLVLNESVTADWRVDAQR